MNLAARGDQKFAGQLALSARMPPATSPYYAPARRMPVGLHGEQGGGCARPRPGEGGPRVNRQPVDLGFVLRQFPRLEFGMHTFGHRLRVQKFVYLLQSFNVYLGYDYSWYLRGPYCSTLAASGFALAGFYGGIPDGAGMRFSSPSVHGRFERFKRFVGGRENDNAFLEMAASLHFLEGMAGLGREETLGRVAGRRPEFTREGCEEARRRLVEAGVLGRSAAAPAAPQGECAYGEPGGCESFVEVPALPDDMDRRPYDKGFYHMLLDSKEAGEKIAVVRRDMFRPDQRRPHIDEITVDDTALLVRLIQGG